MKRYFFIIWILSLWNAPFAFGLTADEIIEEVRKKPFPISGKSVVVLKVFKDDHVSINNISFITKRSKDFTSGKMLVSVTRPSRLKILIHVKENSHTNQWVKLSSGKVKRIIGIHKLQSFIHSHFSIGGLKPSENIILSWKTEYNKYFKAKNLGIVNMLGYECYKIEARPKEINLVKEINIEYDRMEVFLRVSDYFPVRSNFYVEGKLIKYMENHKIKMVGKYPTPFKVIMFIPDSDEKSEIHVKSIKYDIKLFNKKFSKEALR
ncbi:MAG: outer membrane lipoprotein-sorting protein [Spirochaetota bacterium]|nr:outer membrane lipoprotein-sorting protein [Spirochaetota bacterium]